MKEFTYKYNWVMWGVVVIGFMYHHIF